ADRRRRQGDAPDDRRGARVLERGRVPREGQDAARVRRERRPRALRLRGRPRGVRAGAGKRGGRPAALPGGAADGLQGHRGGVGEHRCAARAERGGGGAKSAGGGAGGARGGRRGGRGGGGGGGGGAGPPHVDK